MRNKLYNSAYQLCLKDESIVVSVSICCFFDNFFLSKPLIFFQISQIWPIDADAVKMELPLNLLELPVELRLTIFEYLDIIDLMRSPLVERIFRNVLANHGFNVYIINFL